ncbi:glycosyltransferase family 2 protein, partial [Campylobacter coli]|nr:glycosyltransferase family 2 protein [Campylobacter coli]
EDLSLELLLKQELQNVDRLKVYQNFNKNGLYGAIKTGLKLAVGKYVLILDSDIVIYPDKLKSNLKLLKHNEEKKILFTSSDFATKTEIIYQNYNYIHSYASFIFKREFINRY